MLGFSAIADSPIAGYRQDVLITADSQRIRVYPPGSQIYDASIASTPICGIPEVYSVSGSVTVSGDANTALASQSLAFTQNSVLISEDDVIEVAGQVLQLTQNSVVVTNDTDVPLPSQQINFTLNTATIEVQPPTLDSQQLNLTENSVALITDQVLTLDSQNLALTENSVALSTDHVIDITAETPLALTLHSAAVTTDQVLTVDSQVLLFTENSVSLITDQSIVVASQTIYTELNSLRQWYQFSTAQPGNCPDHCDGTWAEIAFDQEVYGDNFAIAAEPIGTLPQVLPPIRKYPGATWGTIPTTTTTSWTNIQT